MMCPDHIQYTVKESDVTLQSKTCASTGKIICCQLSLLSDPATNRPRHTLNAVPLVPHSFAHSTGCSTSSVANWILRAGFRSFRLINTLREKLNQNTSGIRVIVYCPSRSAAHCSHVSISGAQRGLYEVLIHGQCTVGTALCGGKLKLLHPCSLQSHQTPLTEMLSVGKGCLMAR